MTDKLINCIWIAVFAFILGMGFSLTVLKMDERECQSCDDYCKSIGFEQGCECVPRGENSEQSIDA